MDMVNGQLEKLRADNKRMMKIQKETEDKYH